MRDLFRQLDQELAENSVRNELRVITSILLAMASGGLALAGMMARFSPEDAVPLPGMNHLGGQLGWASLLIVLLLLAAWIVRGVVMKRLQWAVAISLFVHLLICASFHSFTVRTFRGASSHASTEPQGEELTLPEYGGMESPAAEEAAWEKPHDSAAPDSEIELERQNSEIAQPEKFETEDIERPEEITKLDTPEAREQAVFEKEKQKEIERQLRELAMLTPQAVAQPNVEASSATQAAPEAQVELAKSQSAPPENERERSEMTLEGPSLEAAKMTARQAVEKLSANVDNLTPLPERSATEAMAADANQQSVAVSTLEAREATAEEQSREEDRQPAASAPSAEREMTDTPAPSLTASLSRVRPGLASGLETSSPTSPTAGGATSLARRTNMGGGQSGEAAGAEAQSVSVGAAGSADAPQVSESAASGGGTRGAAAAAPLGSADGVTGATLNTPSTGAPTRGTSTLAKQSTGTGEPQLGKPEGVAMATGGGQGRPADAVGTQVGDVAVSSAAKSESNQGTSLASGPAKTAVGRQSSGVGAEGSSSSIGSANLSPTGQVKLGRSNVGTGSTSRLAGPNARLEGSAESAGGATRMARTTNAGSGRTGDATGTVAQGVAVGKTGGVNAPRVSEPAAAAGRARGTTGLPSGTVAAGAGTARALPGTGKLKRGTGQMAKPSQGTGQPQLGQAEGETLTTAGGAGRKPGVVGTDAGEVAVSSSVGRPANERGPLASGPAKTAVDRSSTGLAAVGSSGPSGPSQSPSLISPSGTATAGRSAAGTAMAAKPTEASSRPAVGTGLADGASAIRGATRSAIAANLPSGAEAAELIGELVFSGPQAQSKSAGSLAGPQKGTTVPRRRAGLPGTVEGPANVKLAKNTEVAQPTRLSGGQSRPGVGEPRPTIASESQLAGLIKRVVPGKGSSPEAMISESLSMRKAESRRDATKALGGSEGSEQAVERGLVWLAQHQYADGHWSIHDFPCQDHTCSGHGSFHADTAATGLALLAFLGAGYTHQSGQYQAVVERAVKWHLQHQKPDGDLFADETEFVWFYGHGMASIALCEAYGLTKDPALREPAQKALDFIVAGQHPQFGGWRYRPQFESDTSVSGWQLMALKSGEMSGLKISKEAYAGVTRWLDSVESTSAPGQFTYHPSRPASSAMTAEGLLMRQYLGAKRNDSRLIAGAESLRQHLPDLNQRDAYYWYYGTQVMFHMQGQYWTEWNSRLRDTLVNSQLKDGGSGGSWNPDQPTPEKWGEAGGRHYVTCLNLLMLEVYYRHLPLYLELEK